MPFGLNGGFLEIVKSSGTRVGKVVSLDGKATANAALGLHNKAVIVVKLVDHLDFYDCPGFK